METSQTIGKLSTALAKAQGEIRGATKDSTNPHFRSKYADLSSVRDAIQDALSKHGIAYVQFPEGGPETVTITTVLTCGEEWMRASYSMRPVKADPQGMGSAITYARRYALMAAVGVAPEDDDGNAASNPKSGQGFSPVKNEANRIADEIEACGDREQLDAYMATAEVQSFLKRAEEEAKRFPSGIHLGDLTMQRYHDRHAKIPERKAANSFPDDKPDPTQLVVGYRKSIENAKGNNKMLKGIWDAVTTDPDIFPPDRDALQKEIKANKAGKAA